MKRISLILTALTAVFALAACREELPQPPPFVSEVSLLSEGEVLMACNEVSEFDFAVQPPEAEFIYDVTDPGCEISVEYAGANGQGAGASREFKIREVSRLSAEEGKYRVKLLDNGSGSGYFARMVLKIARRDDQGHMLAVCSTPFTVRQEKAPLFNTMSFLQKDNQTAVHKDLTFSIASGDAVVASPLISSPHLIPSFDSNGAKVYIADEEVISGETLIDFSKPVIFTVKSRIEYRFKVEVIYSGLPVVFIETPGGKQIPSKWEDWLSGSKVTIYNPDWTIDYEGDTGVRGRGNTTWNYPKKPYALKLDSKAEILGMPKHKRWVLLANWMDRTLMRNSVSFELASRSGLAYTPRGQFVELFVNGKHSGNYFLCEHIKVDENRVDIDELDEDEVDGGYIMELDAYFDEVYKFRSPVRDLPYMFKDPDEVNDAQFEFMKNYISELEYALYDDQRFAEGEYLNYIDVESFADWWIVMELTGIWEPNHPKSTYMHKDKGGKLVMGPVWDFDWETYTPKTWFSINESLYYKRLFQDPRFVDVVKQRWDMYKADYETLPEYIRSEAAKIRNSDRMDSPMWPITQWVNGDENMTFDDAVKRMVKVYEDRFDWMDAAIGRM